MIRVIEERCPGDCTRCNLPNEIQGFDLYGCMLHQIFQKTIKLERDVAELKEKVQDAENGQLKDHILTNTHQLEGMNYDTSNAPLPEQDGQERILE